MPWQGGNDDQRLREITGRGCADGDAGAGRVSRSGSFVTHYGKQVHWDGAKDVDAVLLIVGNGPATSTPFVSAEQLK